MKQLKFMLAAATAIGLATAAQAVINTNEIDTINFNSMDVGLLPTDDGTGFYYDYGDNDNESMIYAESDSDRALAVNTGTNPVLRAIYNTQTGAGSINLKTEPNLEGIVIDTQVQFTVTPAGDTVEPNPADKLLIYLQESIDESTGEYATNLVVKAAKVVTSSGNGFGTPTLSYDDTADPVKVDYEVNVNAWYDLKVVATANDDGAVMFEIMVRDPSKETAFTVLNHGGELHSTQNTFFPSLRGKEDSTLTYVGFAGEGKVDDIVFYEIKEVNALDFTFTWSGEGITSVKYTIGTDTTDVDSGVPFQVDPGASFTVNVALADWYKLDQTVYTYNNVTAGATVNLGSATLVTPDNAFDAPADGPAPTATQVAGSLNITNPVFQGTDNAAKESLEKGIGWAQATKQAPTALNDLKFATTNIIVNGEEKQVVVADNEAAEAYLLNCDPNSTAEGQTLQDYKDNFKFDADDLSSLFNLDEVSTEDLQNTLFSDKKYNGSIILEGTESLGGTWEVRKNGHKFFRARLVK